MERSREAVRYVWIFARILGFWGVFKCFIYVFHYFCFPYALGNLGLGLGFVILLAIHVSFSLLVWRMHDWFGNDPYGIASLKEKYRNSEKIHNFRKYFGRSDGSTSKSVWMLKYLIAILIVDPGMIPLFLRRGATRFSLELAMVLIGAFIVTSFWSAYGLAVNAGIMKAKQSSYLSEFFF